MSSNTDEHQASTRSTREPDLEDLRFLFSTGMGARAILQMLDPSVKIPPGVDDATILRSLMSIVEPVKREKLPHYNTIEDAVELIRKSKNILVLSGAGISTSAGLPDFRSRNGIYRQIHEKHPDLRDPKLMFDIKYFKTNPIPFYHFARALYPGQFEPTIGHKFIKCIEDHGQLLNNYAQNIDTLERQAGITRVVECHGSFSTASCTNCNYTTDGESLRKDIYEQRVPVCPLCSELEEGPDDGLGIMKPNIVFFGEQLSNNFHDKLDADKNQVDLLVVIGSSLKVRPVALLPTIIPATVPQILINREPLDHLNFDIELYGNCDDIIQEICLRLGGKWTSVCLPDTKPLTQLTGTATIKLLDDEQDKNDKSSSKRVSNRPSSSRKHDDATRDPMYEGSDRTDRNRASAEIKNENDSDWEDVDSNHSSADGEVNTPKKLYVGVPKSSFIYLRPNKYLFEGTEMTALQYERKLRD